MTYIDMTPTWEQSLPTLLMLLSHGNAKGKQEAAHELQRMAQAADMAVAAAEALKAATI